MRERIEQRVPRAREDDLVVKELPDEVLVYDLSNDKAHCLNHSAALVWKHCDGTLTVSEIARVLEKDLKAPVKDEVVWLALDQLEQFRLLQERVERPAGMARMSRREVMRRIGFSVLVLPAIISITAPTAQAQGTCRRLGQPCDQNNQCCSGICSPILNICL